MINKVKKCCTTAQGIEWKHLGVSENGGATGAEATEVPPPRKLSRKKDTICSWAAQPNSSQGARPRQKQSCADILELVLTFSQNPMT